MMQDIFILLFLTSGVLLQCFHYQLCLTDGKRVLENYINHHTKKIWRILKTLKRIVSIEFRSFSQLQLSQNINIFCLFVQHFRSNYSSICLHTVYSSYLSLRGCFKTKNVLTHLTLFLAPKMTKNRCSLSMVVSYTVGQLMGKRFQKFKNKFDLPFPRISPRL